ncbi:hypothetical protein ScPMuIL_005452 [Solemya velum]
MGCGASSESNTEGEIDTKVNGGVLTFSAANGGISLTGKFNTSLETDWKTNGNDIKAEPLSFTRIEDIEAILDSLSSSELFCDPDFPADNSVLFYGSHGDPRVVWKRPKDIVEEWQQPHMMVDGMTRDDIKQGILGDCWFLSSCAAVSQREKFMSKVMPKDQPLYGDGYRGVVMFRIWRFGSWVDTYVDDRLPTVDGKLLFAKCTDPTEFWVALLEKAYAKLHGSYWALEGGQTMDAMVDLTGGLAERHDIHNKDPNLFRLITQAHKSGAFIACSRKGNWKMSNKADPNGLVSGHAYTMTAMRKLTHRMGEDKLVRIRNPWGDATEWRGSWSDNDVNWNWVDEETKAELGLQSKDDGEFWMSYKDFCKHFSEITLCLTGPDFDGDGISDHPGHMETLKGEWVPGISAGGSRNSLDSFACNPQYLLVLKQADEFNPQTDDPENEGTCSIVVALMQEQTQHRQRAKIQRLQISFMIYKANDTCSNLTAQHFRYNNDCGKSGVYINFREVSNRFDLEPGNYVIIPSTFNAGESSTFVLRVFGEKSFSLKGPI